MTTAELEKRLREHAEAVKSIMVAPFDIESEELKAMKKKYNIKKAAVLAAAVICALGTTVFAAYHFLSPRQIANEVGDAELSRHFADDGIASETIADGEYKATVLGMASGADISDFKASSWDIYPDRTYVAVAVEKADGSEMTYDDEIMVTPLIEGLKPWQYNIVTMHGGYSAKIIDGVLYRIIECDSVEFFADKRIYLAVIDEAFLSNQHYKFSQSTGEITVNEEYSGTNILFELNIDKSKANPDKAAEYLASLGF